MQWRNLAILGAIFIFMIEPAVAGNTTGMPWENPLDTIQRSLTGPVAMVISILGVFVTGGMLIFGGELGEFTRRMIMVVLAISVMVSAAAILTQLFGGTGALVTHDQQVIDHAQKRTA